jgi:adenosylcobinamide kinase/adenosylcobinamide-phosphate guanylyltransferase
MGLIMVTGGASSGKSEFAEKMALEYGGGSVLYIATSIPIDDEMKERIRRHRERRSEKWGIVEAFKGLKNVIISSKKKVILLDCLTVMITNFIMEKDLTGDNLLVDEINDLEGKISDEVDGIIEGALKHAGDTIIVTNEIGMGLVPEYKLGRIFRDIAGRMNMKIAEAAEVVYLTVSGIPIKIKGR